MNKRKWTVEEDEYIRSNFGKITYVEMSKTIGCSTDTIKRRAKVLGFEVKKEDFKRWTKEEEQLLIEYSSKYVTKTIAKKLNRSYIAVQKKAIKLGVQLHSTKDPWKKWMIDYLKDNINKKPIGEIESIINLSYHQIVRKCEELKIQYIKETWTEEEIEILKEYAPKCFYTELTKVLPNRTIGAISAKAYDLGIKTISSYAKLSEDDIEYIKNNWGKISCSEIARNLKISIGILNRYKQYLNLPNVGQQKKWTNKNIEKLRKDAKEKNRTELAKIYKTSVTVINKIAAENDIKLINSRNIWTKEMDDKLLKLLEAKKSVNEIAELLEVKASLVRSHMKILGLSTRDIKNSRQYWNDDEVALLKELCKDKTSYEIAEILGKEEKKVVAKARSLRIKISRNIQNYWQEEEIKTLLELKDDNSLHTIAQKINKSEDAIRKKAKELGITLKSEKRHSWSKEEEIQLRNLAEEYTAKDIATIMNLSITTVNNKLKYMGISALKSDYFWTKEEEIQLVELSEKLSIEEIALTMDKSYGSVSSKLAKMNLHANSKSVIKWTKEEEKQLEELLQIYSLKEISIILNRTEEAICTRARLLGYNVDNLHRKWTKEEEILLEDLWGTISIEKIAAKLNRSISAILNKVGKLGLGSQISNNYEGLVIQEIADMFLISRQTILTTWVSLGLKLKYKKRSNHNMYAYVEIKDLFDFLEANQNIWDSRLIDENTLGKEPEWLKEKRKKDRNMPVDGLEKTNIIKQQLLLSKKYILEEINENKLTDHNPLSLTRNSKDKRKN